MGGIATPHKRAMKPSTEDELGIETALYCIRLNVCKELGLKATEFAELLHCTRQTICKWENNFSELSENMHIKALSTLSHVYGIPPEEFENSTRILIYYAKHKKEILNHVSKLRG